MPIAKEIVIGENAVLADSPAAASAAKITLLKNITLGLSGSINFLPTRLPSAPRLSLVETQVSVTSNRFARLGTWQIAAKLLLG